ncbi:unnamed protein product [Closterium sp. Naga37s-1]|nr:unnamed protein product [Closterium sp. Naga37s-1]
MHLSLIKHSTVAGALDLVDCLDTPVPGNASSAAAASGDDGGGVDDGDDGGGGDGGDDGDEEEDDDDGEEDSDFGCDGAAADGDPWDHARLLLQLLHLLTPLHQCLLSSPPSPHHPPSPPMAPHHPPSPFPPLQ